MAQDSDQHAEQRRLEALRRYHISGDEPEPVFDRIAEEAAAGCECPMATVTVVGAQRQVFKARVGLSMRGTDRAIAFCDHTIASGALMEVPDALADPRFRDNPLVTGEPRIRFYAGAPVLTPQGEALGTVSVMDTRSRALTASQAALLRSLAREAAHLLELRMQLAERDRLQAERDRAYQELRQYADHLADAQAIAALGSWSRDMTTGRLFWSPETHRIMGIPPEAFDGRPEHFLENLHPEDRELWFGPRDAALESGAEGFEAHHRIVRPDGEIRHLTQRARVHRNERGEAVLLTGTVQDVTEQVQARRRLEESEALLRMAGETARLGGWYLNLDSNEVVWSDVTCDIHEAPRGTRVDVERGIDYYVPEDRGRIRAAVERCIAEGTPFDEELRIVTASGRRIWVRTVGEAVRDEQGNVVRLQGAFQNIDQRRRAEERAQALAGRLRHMLQQISDAFFTLDTEYRFTFVNQEAARVLGQSADELLGEVIWERCGMGPDSPFARAYRQAMQSREPVSVEDFYDPAGAWLDVRVHPTEEGLAVYFRDVTEQRRAREQLYLLESSVARLNDMVIITEAEPVDRPGPRIVYVNDAVLRQTGYGRDELIGQSPRILQGADTDSAELARIRAALEAGEPVQAELANYDRHGNRYWVELDITPLADAQGRISHFVAVQRNIDERVATERALRDSEERFRNVARATADAVWDWDLATDNVWWSEGMETLFGYRLEDLPPDSRSWTEHIHPDDRERILADIHTVLDGTENRWEGEYRFKRRDGSVAQVMDRGFVIRDRDGRAVRMVGGMTDVTEQRAYQARIAEQAALLDQARDAIIVRDLDQRVTFWNRAAERIYGWPRSQALGADLGRLIGEDTDNHQEALAHLHRHGEWTGRIRQRRRDGSPITVEAHWSLVTDEQDRPKAIFAINSDITQELALERQLQQAQRLEAIGQLTGGVAHDFNNLLTVMLGNADLLTRLVAEQDRPRQLAELILGAAERSAELTNRLLAFARRQPLQPEPTDINALVGDMEALLRRTLGEDMELRLIRNDAAWPAQIDPGQLESALLNLCLNARDAMPGGGRLTIETGNAVLDAAYAAQNSEVAPGEYVLVAVSDTGEGIAAEALDKVFDPFYTTKSEGKGSGLGLSMVYGFAKQYRGHVKIYSEPGQGTTVRLYLPRAHSQETPTRTTPMAGDTPGGGETVLVVEDNAMVRQHAEALLTDLGYRVLSAPDAEAALGVLQGDTEIDLLFTDVVMPGGMNGRELAAAARDLRPGLRVLYTSGYTENAIVHHGRLDPGVHLLQKPYRQAELASKVREVLDEPA